MRCRDVGKIVVLGLVVACKPGPPSADDGGSSSDTTVADGSDSDSETETSSGSEDTETTGPLPCEPELLDACWSEASAALSSCASACACDDVDCSIACYDAYGPSFSDCFELHCDDPTADGCALCSSTYSCQSVCDEQRSDCVDEGCDSNMCWYQEMRCGYGCDLCALITLEFSYADACEIALPGPPAPDGEAFMEVVIGQYWPVSGEDLSCDDPDVAIVWADEQHDRLLLCSAACEAYATLGEAVVEFDCPPSE